MKILNGKRKEKENTLRVVFVAENVGNSILILSLACTMLKSVVNLFPPPTQSNPSSHTPVVFMLNFEFIEYTKTTMTTASRFILHGGGGKKEKLKNYRRKVFELTTRKTLRIRITLEGTQGTLFLSHGNSSVWGEVSKS